MKVNFRENGKIINCTHDGAYLGHIKFCDEVALFIPSGAELTLALIREISEKVSSLILFKLTENMIRNKKGINNG